MSYTNLQSLFILQAKVVETVIVEPICFGRWDDGLLQRLKKQVRTHCDHKRTGLSTFHLSSKEYQQVACPFLQEEP